MRTVNSQRQILGKTNHPSRYFSAGLKRPHSFIHIATLLISVMLIAGGPALAATIGWLGQPVDVIPQSDTDSSSPVLSAPYEPEVRVNGQSIPVPSDGEVDKTVTTEDGSIDIEVKVDSVDTPSAPKFSNHSLFEQDGDSFQLEVKQQSQSTGGESDGSFHLQIDSNSTSIEVNNSERSLPSRHHIRR